ncbi:MAG TPA: hypothetical protein VNA87_03280, partial [Actinomycetota bacterium]|nr:hypothetical protein [Actinomycetota bacterium]
MRKIATSLFAVLLLVGSIQTHAIAEDSIFLETRGFATKIGFRGVFSWEASQPVLARVHYGTNPAALTLATKPTSPDLAGMSIADGLVLGSTYYWQVEDLITGERSEIKSFKAANAYNAWDPVTSSYTINLLVQIDAQSLPPEVPHDMALANVAQGMNIFGERLYDASDGFVRLGEVLVTDTNLDYAANLPNPVSQPPPVCAEGNFADVLVTTAVPFDSHTYSGYQIARPCTSFYVGRIGQLVVPWGSNGSAEDLHFGYVSTHELFHYAFNAPDLYNVAHVNTPRISGCWNLDWDGSLMHNDGGWAAKRWEFTEVDRNPTLTPCD